MRVNAPIGPSRCWSGARWLAVVVVTSLLAAGCAAASSSAGSATPSALAPASTSGTATPGVSAYPGSRLPLLAAAEERIVRRMADFLLSLQAPSGAIRDEPGSTVSNEDSNMEYALLGLAAAYGHTGDARYLRGFEAGVTWLAARQEMADPRWRGSWYYVYAVDRPFRQVPTSPGGGAADVRGVDTTSALFAYLLYVDAQLPGNSGLAARYAENAQAGLDFVIARNWAPIGATYSSWQLRDGRWRLWRYLYTADQADVLLGMRAGAALYPQRRAEYERRADQLTESLRTRFFDRHHGRYAEGLDDGVLDWEASFDAVFPQGYVPWVLGERTRESRAAHRWLLSKQRSDGRLVAFRGDPGYALSASMLALAAAAVHGPRPVTAITWLLQAGPYDSASGGVRDTADRAAPRYSNVAGFTILALLRQGAMEWSGA